MKTIKYFSSLLILLCSTTYVLAQGPNNSGTYYQNANGKKGEALKTALYSIIKEHKTIGYSGLDEYYKLTDKRSDGYVRDWYSNITSYDWNKHGNSSEGAGWNKEHTVPQSWFKEASPMKSDIVHVVPTDCYINGMRSAYVIAEVGTVEKHSANNYSLLGSCKTTGYSGKVFEPNDEVKGDIARIYFYMATCYQDKLKNWTNGEASKVFTSTEYPGLQEWYLNMLFRWSRLDPVDEVERARNNAIASNEVQGNRNPFVDYPGLENYIWGTKQDQSFSYDNYEDGGEIPDIVIVNQPVFTPKEGVFLDQAVVSISTSTAGATIYYTTDNTDATTQSIVYTEPITITETTTLKAIAVKDGTSSNQVTATYTIKTGSDEEPIEGFIALNNTFFGVSYNGVIAKSNSEDLVGMQNGVTVTYALGDGGENRYCSNEQIRLYKKNQLTFSVNNGNLSELEFQLAKETSKTLYASTGSIDGLTWTGYAPVVVINVDDGSGNMQLSGVMVKVTGSTDVITTIDNAPSCQQNAIYTLSGQRIDHPSKSGFYIRNGKVFVVR